MATTILQLTDTHLQAEKSGMMKSENPYENLRAVLDYIEKQQLQFDCTLVTGDLGDGSEASYQLLSESLKNLPGRKYWMPGNHDHFQNMENHLDRGFTHEKSIDFPDCKIILLNSQKEGKVEGRLDQDQLSFLKRELGNAQQSAILIAMHHPPVKLGTPWMDDINVENAGEFYKVIDGDARVKMVLCGHVHHEHSVFRNGVLYVTTPATSLQFSPDTEKPTFGERNSGEEWRPGFRMIYLNDDGSIRTRVFRVE